VRDESDRDGMRVVVEVKRGSSASVRLSAYIQQLTEHLEAHVPFAGAHPSKKLITSTALLGVPFSI